MSDENPVAKPHPCEGVLCVRALSERIRNADHAARTVAGMPENVTPPTATNMPDHHLQMAGEDVFCRVAAGSACRYAAGLEPPASTCPDAIVPSSASSSKLLELPHWDGEARLLTMNGLVVKRFRQPAANQEAILAAFQELNWLKRIDDPLSPHGKTAPKVRLHFTIRCLNGHQEHKLLTFFGDGTGEGICWAANAETISAHDDDPRLPPAS